MKLDSTFSTNDKVVRNPLMNKNRKRDNSSTTSKLTDVDDIFTKSELSDETVPQRLLYELALLSPLKYKINVRSKSFSLNLPVITVDRDSLGLTTTSEADGDNNKYSDYITLTCKISNTDLPLVPPIKILVPYDYPNTNGFVECIHSEELKEDMLPNYRN